MSDETLFEAIEAFRQAGAKAASDYLLLRKRPQRLRDLVTELLAVTRHPIDDSCMAPIEDRHVAEACSTAFYEGFLREAMTDLIACWARTTSPAPAPPPAAPQPDPRAPPPTPTPIERVMAELRLLVDAARPLTQAAEGLCPEAPRPELCAVAARETLASLADAEALLGAVEACQGDDARRCLEEAAVVASETAPRLAARLGRLMLLTQPRERK